MKIPLTGTEGGAFLQRYEAPPGVPVKGSVVICPGGGYAWLSPREGEPVARAFGKGGWNAYVLNYSVDPAPLGDKPLHELAEAVRRIRGRGDGGPSGERVAVCGFSAGGHLAASLGVHWNDGRASAGSAAGGSARPDALVLCYPVITSGDCGHRPSMERLSGGGGDGGELFSVERHVSSKTPPSFLWHTATDAEVPCENSLLFAGALKNNGVPVELHIYPRGPHGLSLATPEVDEPEKGRLADPHVAGWFEACLHWLEYTLLMDS